MFKIFGCKGIFKEGIPYIILAVTRKPNIDYLDGYVLIIRPNPEESILLPQRVKFKYSMPVESLGNDFQEQQLLKWQFSWLKNHLFAWLYEQRKGVFIPEQNLEWEELKIENLIIPFAVMFHSEEQARQKVILIRDQTLCTELKEFLNKIRDLKLKIEKVKED